MADYTTFTARYPEFLGADPLMVQSKLDESTRQLDATLWGVLSDDGIYLLTAQKLARSPFGNSAKLSTTDGRTVFDFELERLRADVGTGRGIT